MVLQGIIERMSLDDRGIKAGDFHVIRENNQAAILLELGLLSNLNDETIISTISYQRSVAEGIVNDWNDI